MTENPGTRSTRFVPHFIVIALAAVLTGLVHQLPTWTPETGIEGGLLPFLIVALVGLLMALIASLLTASMAGAMTGFLIATSGILFNAVGATPLPKSGEFAAAYILILTGLGACIGFLAGLPVRIARIFLRRRQPG